MLQYKNIAESDTKLNLHLGFYLEDLSEILYHSSATYYCYRNQVR